MVAVENRGAVFPRSSKSSVGVRAINDEELGDGAIFHHLTGRYRCTCLNGACGWLRQTKPRAVSRRTRSTPRTRITRLGAVP